MNALYDLWVHKNEEVGRVNITLFFVNIFLIMCHIFSLVVYIVAKHYLMVVLDICFLMYYCLMFLACTKYQVKYVGFAFMVIWIHMIFAILSFGWTPCFQNWSFAMLAACFLPSYETISEKKSPLSSVVFAVMVIITYFALGIVINIVPISFNVKLGDSFNRLLFVFNNLFSFFTIVMFALFYTLKSKRKEFELSRKADYDELTNLYNRYAITQIHLKLLNEAMESNKNYNIAILDIDFFKKVNDTYGHNSGDTILKEIAKLLKLMSLKIIIPGRWGGEEFILLAPSSVKYKDFVNILRKINLKISKTKYKVESGKEINITVSIGSASVHSDLSIEEAVKVADENLYEAKNSGRNKVVS